MLAKVQLPSRTAIACPSGIALKQQGPAAVNATLIRSYFSVKAVFRLKIKGCSLLLFYCQDNRQGGDDLARSNYQFNKRQKELARKKKKAEKRQSRLERSVVLPDETAIESQDEKNGSAV